MKTFDLCVGWANKVDEAFVTQLKRGARRRRLSFYEVTLSNLWEAYTGVTQSNIFFRTFINRADFDNPGFVLLAQRCKQQGTKVVNDPESALRYGSKTDLLPLMRALRVPLPRVVVIHRKKNSKFPRAAWLRKIMRHVGRPFILKPSVGGFVGDVHVGAKTVQDIKDFWDRFSAEDVLIHEYVQPQKILGRVAWVRAIYICGEVIPLWWHPQTHIYAPLGRTKREQVIAEYAKVLLRKIGNAVGMDLFSTEIVIDKEGKYVVVDYVNHPVDLNTTRKVKDGLPPRVLTEIGSIMLRSVKGGSL